MNAVSVNITNFKMNKMCGTDKIMHFSDEENDQNLDFETFDYSEEVIKKTSDFNKLQFLHKFENPLS